MHLKSIHTGLLAILLLVVLAPAHAAGLDADYPQLKRFFPEATRFGMLEGDPPAAAVYRQQKIIGYAFLSSDVVQIPAYSGKPITTLIGFNLNGRITGIEIVHHEEPILVVGISEEKLQAFVRQYEGKSVFDKITIGAEREGYVAIDAISGATITMMVENASVMQSVRRVAESRGLTLPSATGTSQAPAARRQPVLPRTVLPAGELATEEPIWVGVWRARTSEIALLVAGLGLLTLMLIFQDWLARRPLLLRRLRTGFLIYTLVFIGWGMLAQLSVVNVLTFTQAVMHGFQWQGFLIDPLLFILWSFVAMTLLLWGRGVYCGWLCPFGALQELSWQLGNRFRLRSFEMPQMIHERLWALKYIILLVLFGLSLQSLPLAEAASEVEPFKTVITLRFLREWGFVLYAGVLITIGLFQRKFYCKYLCALGAALTIAGKFRIFDWLRRHRECGRPCQICAVECEVQAIKRNGEINPNECHYCLDCQVTYWNDHKCPPLVEKRKRREKAERAREVVGRMEEHLGPAGIPPVPGKTEPKDRDSGPGST
jgi:polyferredoxin